MNRTIKLVVSALIPVMLAGCASVPKDAGFGEVRQEIAGRLDERVEWRRGGTEDAAVDAQVKAVLHEPLTADAAVRVALLNNRRLQAEYEDLGVAQADLVQAGLLKNPSFGWSRLDGGGMTQTTWGVGLDFLGLLLAAPKKRIESIRFEHIKSRVTQAVLRHVAETRKAWFTAMAAEQSAGFLGQVAELAAAEAELGERQRQAGNLSQRDALRQQAFSAETAASLARAREAAFAARERLNRLMGVWGEDAGWKLPGRLPELPESQPVFDGIEAYGLKQRLDVRMAQKEAEAMAAALGVTRDSRFINVFGLGAETEKDTGERRITGPTLKLELPIFDQGQARVSRQEALYRQSEARLYALTVDARSEMRESYQRAVTAYGAARHARDVVVPLRRQIVEQSTLHYNGMLIGVYELLADARDQVGAVQSSIAATRDFWVALADLQFAVGGRLPQTMTSAPPASLPATAPAADGNAGHHH